MIFLAHQQGHTVNLRVVVTGGGSPMLRRRETDSWSVRWRRTAGIGALLLSMVLSAGVSPFRGGT